MQGHLPLQKVGGSGGALYECYELFGHHAVAMVNFLLQTPDASREASVDNESFSNIHTKAQLSTSASHEASVDNNLF